MNGLRHLLAVVASVDVWYAVGWLVVSYHLAWRAPVGDGLLQGGSPAALMRQSLPPLAIGTVVAALVFGLIGRWRQAPRVPSGSHGR